MKINFMSDSAIGEMIGARLQALRLKNNISQDEIAREAGISRQTLYQLLTHGKGTVSTLTAVLRAIGELDRLSSLIAETRPSPLAIIKMAGKTRSRATGARKPKTPSAIHDGTNSAPAKKDIDW